MMAETIEQAKETAIRNDERRKIAAEVQRMRQEKIDNIFNVKLLSPQRDQGAIGAYSAVMKLLGVKL